MFECEKHRIDANNSLDGRKKNPVQTTHSQWIWLYAFESIGNRLFSTKNTLKIGFLRSRHKCCLKHPLFIISMQKFTWRITQLREKNEWCNKQDENECAHSKCCDTEINRNTVDVCFRRGCVFHDRTPYRYRETCRRRWKWFICIVEVKKGRETLRLYMGKYHHKTRQQILFCYFFSS